MARFENKIKIINKYADERGKKLCITLLYI